MSDAQPLWSDDQRPWVNEELNSNSKLGVAARLMSRWGKDWHKEFMSLTYDYAHNEIADMADAITTLLIERDECEAELYKLKAQLAQPPDAPTPDWAQGLVVNEYQVDGQGYPWDDIVLRRMPQGKGPDKWAIYKGGIVLDRSGHFVYEPLPSNRDEDFMRRCRFDTPQEALARYRQQRPAEEQP